MRLIDLTGKKFGRLTVLCREGTYQRPSGNKEPTWRCVCECGNEVVVQSSNLKRKNTLSCGCLQSENRKVPRRETEYEILGDVAYIKSFEGVEFIINTCDLDAVLKHRWHSNGHGYMADEHGNTIHRFLMKPPAVMDVHHINENKLDNRRINLLMMSRSEHTALHQRKGVSNGVTVQEWISVKERLPKKDGKYLVRRKCSYGSYLEILWFAKDGRKVCKYDFEREWKNVWYWYDRECGYITSDSVTHWMPLPEPPKGE